MSKNPKTCARCAVGQLRAIFVSNDNRSEPSVYLPCNCEISAPSYVAKVGKAVVELEMPRRQLPDWVCSVIERFDRIDGKTFYRDGTPYDLARLPDFGEAFGDDANMTNVRDLMGCAVRQPNRVRQEMRDRVRLVSTALLIERSDLAWKYDL